ncbi:MAG: ABC transporter permease subunit/CPBP intramembrane protease, partial [Pirellulaceae bacterium]
MKWANVKLIFIREVRDQLRDRRTMFTIAVLPLLLYPLMGMSILQVAQFTREHPTTVLVLGADALPEEPLLLEGDQFAGEFISPDDAQRLKLTVEGSLSAEVALEGIGKYAERGIASKDYDAIVLFPEDFSLRLGEFRERLDTANGNGENHSTPVVPEPQIFVNTADEKSRMARDRVARVLRLWREAIVQDNLRQRNVPVSATEPFQLKNTDVSRERNRRAAMWSKILPFIVLIWALTGAFYPAIDVCAGEKERGTLETLLCSPAQRSEIVWGKLLTIMAFSIATSVLNLLSMGATSLLIIGRMGQMGDLAAGIGLGPPPLAGVAWLLLGLIPIAALFSALALAIAAFARSSKEGQYYLMPLLLITLPLILLPMGPTAELNLGSSLIPVTGMMHLLKSLIEGHYLEALRYTIPVLGVTALCCLLSIRWAIDQFNNESVLFRESERWQLGLWLRHVMRDREATPSIGQALLCGMLILIIRFFAAFYMQMPETWSGFATSTIVTLIAFVATPALLMAVVLTRSPAKALLVRMPRPAALPMAVLLAIAIHPAGVALAAGVRTLYPFGPDVLEQMGAISNLVNQAPSLWSILFVLALLPAFCEELAFRGFILSGLRHMGDKWAAILVSSIFFGAAHGILQQSLTACVLGMVIGYVAVQTGSIFPGLLMHLAYNGMSLALAWSMPFLRQDFPAMEWLLAGEGDDLLYRWPTICLSLVLSTAVLLWFRSLPFQATAEEALHDALATGE